MRKVALFLLVFCPLVFVTAQEDSQDEQGRIIALENAWNVAEQKHDVRGLDQLLAPDFVNTDYDGTFMSRAQFLASVKSDTEQLTSLGNTDVTVRIYPNGVAVVAGVYHEKGVVKGGPIDRRGRFTDTWVKQNGKWLCAATQVTLIRK